MPKIKHSTSKGVHTRVEPWQDAEERRRAAAQLPAAEANTVQFASLVVAGAEQGIKRKEPDRHPARAAAVAPTGSDGWLSARERPSGGPGAVASSSAPHGQPHGVHGEGLLWDEDPAGPAAEEGHTEDEEDEQPAHRAEGEDEDMEQQQDRAGPAAEAPDSDDSFNLGEPQPRTSCSGVAQLALLPSGNLSGHLIDGTTHGCYGLVGKQVEASAAPTGCRADEDARVLRLQLVNFQSKESVDAVVCRSGGDLAKLEPAEDWQLGKYLALRDKAEVEAALKVAVTFNPTALHDGPGAEQLVAKFSPRLLGRGAVVNVGHMRVAGLPPGFL